MDVVKAEVIERSDDMVAFRNKRESILSGKTAYIVTMKIGALPNGREKFIGRIVIHKQTPFVFAEYSTERAESTRKGDNNEQH